MANRPDNTSAHTDFRPRQLLLRARRGARDRHRLAAQLPVDGRRRHRLLHRAEPDDGDASRARRGTAAKVVSTGWSTVVSADYSWDDAQADFHDSIMVQLSIPVISAANLDPANDRGRQLLDCLGTRNLQAWSTTAARSCGPADRVIRLITLRIAHAFATVLSVRVPRTSRCNRSGEMAVRGCGEGESSRQTIPMVWPPVVCRLTRRAHCRSPESRWPVAAEALEQSMLESKDKEQLLAIAQALGIKTTSRAAKATLIDKILGDDGWRFSRLAAPPSTNGRATKASKEVRQQSRRPTMHDRCRDDRHRARGRFRHARDLGRRADDRSHD